MVQLELIEPLEVELVGTAPEAIHRIVERVVPRVGRHVDELEVGLLEGRQDPGQDHVAAAFLRGFPGLPEQLAELPLHVTKTGVAEYVRIEIELEVEARELGGEMGIVNRFQDLGGDRRRTPELINQEQFLFGADSPDTGLESLLFEHLLEGPHVFQEVPEKDPDFLGPRLFANVLLTHRCFRDSFSAGRYCTPCK